MPTLLNICGASRSGTTMLDLMLGNAPDAFSCGEVYAWFRPWRTSHFKIVCPCKKDPCPYWEKIKNFPEDEFHKQVFKQLNVNFVIDSSKEICWIIDNNKWVAKNGIKVVNLLLWKNPIDFAYSYWKRSGDLQIWRKHFLKYYKEFWQSGVPFVSVYFTDLTKNPGGKLEDICKLVGMKYFPGKENFWEKEHHHLFGSLGTRSQLENKRQNKIRTSENFSPDFEKNLTHLHSMIKGDIMVQEVLEKLKAYEISQNNYTNCVNQKVSHIVYPIWYYLKWFKRIYKRHFPDLMP